MVLKLCGSVSGFVNRAILAGVEGKARTGILLVFKRQGGSPCMSTACEVYLSALLALTELIFHMPPDLYGEPGRHLLFFCFVDRKTRP
jgi:hypothetical protein